MKMFVALVAFCAFCVQTVACCSINISEGIVYEYAPINYTIQLTSGGQPVYLNGTGDTYSLKGNLSKYFAVNAQNLMVSNSNIKRSLGVIDGLITCQNTNGTANISTIINVLKVNNVSKLNFQGAPYAVDVKETEPLETLILKVCALDNDTNNIEYQLQGDDSFSIDDSGSVMIVKKLDYRNNTMHHMTIIATSIGFNSTGQYYYQSTNTNLTVTVLNTDLHPPQFEFSDCNGTNEDCGVYKAKVTVGETEEVLKILPNNITALDLDFNNASITYRFAWGDPANYIEYFIINQSTGIVSMNKSVPKPEMYFMEVEATESTGKVSTASFYVEAVEVPVSPPSYPDSVVYGIIGGWIACFVIFIAVAWYLIWKLRQKPVKSASNSEVHRTQDKEVRYVGSPQNRFSSTGTTTEYNTQNPLNSVSWQTQHEMQRISGHAASGTPPNEENNYSENISDIYNDVVAPEPIYESSPGVSDDNGHDNEMYEQPVTVLKTGRPVYQNAQRK